MNEKELTHIDLFSGIGGFSLAGEWAGFRTIVFCEKDEFCQKVLQKRFGAIIADTESMGRRNGVAENKGKKPRKINPFSNQAPLLIPEIRDFDGTKWRSATLLTGGFPCQPFSVAGPRTGKEDDRYLWPEMLRIIKEARPRWVLAENVPGIFRMALDTVLADLENEGYATGTFIIPACGLNAPHRRNRAWIIANSINDRMRRGNHGDSRGSKCTLQIKRPIQRADWEKDWHEVAARFCRVDDGISDRVYRLKALGNAIVPQVAYEILKNIAWIEKG